MAHRVFRLSIAPERAPEVRRVFDFDGRSTLHDVHAVIQREFHLDDDHLYAFYLSGRYFDASSEHSLSSDSAHDSQRSVLFRLRLNVGQQLDVEGDCVATTHNEVRPSAMELDRMSRKSSKSSIIRAFEERSGPQRFGWELSWLQSREAEALYGEPSNKRDNGGTCYGVKGTSRSPSRILCRPIILERFAARSLTCLLFRRHLSQFSISRARRADSSRALC